MLKSEIISSLKPLLKEKGFKKIRNYWYMVQDKMTFYINVQGSSYGSDDFYVNFGIVLSLFKGKIPPIYEWDVCRRAFVNEKQTNFDIDDILLMLDYFLDLFSTRQAAEKFVKRQIKQYEHIVISDCYKLI